MVNKGTAFCCSLTTARSAHVHATCSYTILRAEGKGFSWARGIICKQGQGCLLTGGVRQARIEDTIERHRKRPAGALAEAMSTLLESASVRAAEADLEGSTPTAGNHFEPNVFQSVCRATDMESEEEGSEAGQAGPAAAEPAEASRPARRQRGKGAGRAAPQAAPKAAGEPAGGQICLCVVPLPVLQGQELNRLPSCRPETSHPASS